LGNLLNTYNIVIAHTQLFLVLDQSESALQ